MRKPFLKWAGGKFRLLPKILPAISGAESYVEPFAGSAAVWLNAEFESAVVADANADLISLYSFLKGEGVAFIDYCASFFAPENNSAEAYAKLRERFNASSCSRERAALLVYLNKHCYNGLTRFNSKGGFNVPFGKYANPSFPREEMLAFRDHAGKTDFVNADFREIMASLREGDACYCDPPYAPLDGKECFTNYTGNAFPMESQRELASLAAEAVGRGAVVAVSNHGSLEIEKLYAGAEIIRFPARRSISCKGDGRKAVPEILAVFR